MDIQLVNIFSTTVSVLKDPHQEISAGQKDPERRQVEGQTDLCLVCSFYVPAQHEFGVFGHILLHEVLQQTLHDLGEVLQFIVQRHGEQTSNVATVSLREPLLGLQCVNKLRKTRQSKHHLTRHRTPPPQTITRTTHPREEEPVVEQVVKLLQALFHSLPPGLRKVQLPAQWRRLLAREENSLCICLVVQQGQSWSSNITAKVHHLCHQVCRRSSNISNMQSSVRNQRRVHKTSTAGGLCDDVQRTSAAYL